MKRGGVRFIGEASAGQRSAIIYTVIECCRRRGIDPFANLRDVLTRLPSMTKGRQSQSADAPRPPWADQVGVFCEVLVSGFEAWAKTKNRADRRVAA